MKSFSFESINTKLNIKNAQEMMVNAPFDFKYKVIVA